MIEMSSNRSNAHRVSVSGMLLDCCKRPQLTEEQKLPVLANSKISARCTEFYENFS